MSTPPPSSLTSSAILSTPSDPDSSNNNNNTTSNANNSTQSSSSPLILYTPPTAFSLLRSAAINLFLPFINGLMLGFGELFAHEIAFRLGWSGTNVSIYLLPFACSTPGTYS
ncbi:hypothetical protein ABW19_dt0209831 [Dactylella cylindrospora]|nr:hypothetical protein ABW19_dt0209831 [Dactylella cylindrospora]